MGFEFRFITNCTIPTAPKDNKVTEQVLYGTFYLGILGHSAIADILLSFGQLSWQWKRPF